MYYLKSKPFCTCIISQTKFITPTNFIFCREMSEGAINDAKKEKEEFEVKKRLLEEQIRREEEEARVLRERLAEEGRRQALKEEISEEHVKEIQREVVAEELLKVARLQYK